MWIAQISNPLEITWWLVINLRYGCVWFQGVVALSSILSLGCLEFIAYLLPVITDIIVNECQSKVISDQVSYIRWFDCRSGHSRPVVLKLFTYKTTFPAAYKLWSTILYIIYIYTWTFRWYLMPKWQCSCGPPDNAARTTCGLQTTSWKPLLWVAEF